MLRLLILFFLVTNYALVNAQTKIPQKGRWIAYFELQKEVRCPITLQWNSETDLHVINGTEDIAMRFIKKSGDTLHFDFPDFYSSIIWVKQSKKQGTGYFINRNKKQTVHFYAQKSDKPKFSLLGMKQNQSDMKLAPKYETYFNTQSEQPEKAIALFDQKRQMLTGSFLTETGDYRFLSGNVIGNQLFLSCLDGSHLFLFAAQSKNDTLYGKFYSGSTYSTDWKAWINNKVELTNPYALTFTKDEANIQFSFPRLNGDTFYFPKNNNKAPLTIYQIMGTWCPNCMDETKYYLELYEKYHERGLNIVTIGFEYTDDPNFHKQRLEQFKKRYNVPYPILIGGSNSKAQTSGLFPFLNEITSYPTSFFVNPSGEIIKIHTGFSGPGTGVYFETYKKDLESFIEQQLR